MKRRIFHSALLFAMLTSGCELVADFDRGKLASDQPDSGARPLPPDEDDDAGVDAGRDAGAGADASDDDAGQ